MDDEGRTPDDTVTLVSPDARWAGRFAQAEAVLRRVLPEARRVEHIGSTAVPGLLAKDTIDVLVVIDDLAIVRERAPALAVAGYDLRLGARTTTDDQLFLRRVVGGHRTHHVHALLPTSPAVAGYVLFRDYLRAHPDAVARYGEAKARLAARHADDRMAYVLAKPAIVEPLLVEARAWAAASPLPS